MRKTFALFCLVLGLGAFISSCSKSDSYAEKLKDEQKAIEKFISDNKIVVLNLYPANSKFAANEFYKDPSGVYIHVVDTGNGKRAGLDTKSEVHFRFSDATVLPVGSSDTISNDGPGQMPLTFISGLPAGSSIEYDPYRPSSGYYESTFMSPAFVYALKYVGEGGIVKMIVPFNQGSYVQVKQLRQALYFGKVKYTKIYNNE